MNYVQRLFNGIVPGPQIPSAAILPPGAASSPVVAADQRLGVFPGLIDPFGQSPALPEAGPPEGESLAPEIRSPVPNSAPPQADAGPVRQARDNAAPPTISRDDGGTFRAVSDPIAASPLPQRQDRPDPGPMSPLQRLVESNPLPDHPAAASAEPVRPDEQPDVAAAPPAQSSPGLAPEAVLQPAQAAAPEPQGRSPLFINPAIITPDQFKPSGGPESDATGPVPVAAPLEPATASVEPSPVEPLSPPAPAAPLEPAPNVGPSPFARQADLPPAPDARTVAADAAKPAPERIIERIREVPVTPPAPPRAMTAASQSVIGPLGQRRSGRWQPRQGGF